MSEERFRIGDLAKLTDTTPRTIRYYEEIGLLAPGEAREPGAHRTYGEDDLERLRDLLRLRELLGVSLDELRELAAAESARASLRARVGRGNRGPGAPASRFWSRRPGTSTTSLSSYAAVGTRSTPS